MASRQHNCEPRPCNTAKDYDIPPRIAILGAGIGGLALAIALIRRDIPVTVYEAAEVFSPIGAGIGLGPNSLAAMDIIDPEFRLQYDMISTSNERMEFDNSVFDALYAEPQFGEKRGWKRGLVGADYFHRMSAHRKDLLEIMTGLIPEGTVKFSKHAQKISQTRSGVEIYFQDGDFQVFDALIGCDGIKGSTRSAVLGEKWQEQVAARYTHCYIYRGILPMADAKSILGQHAGDAKWFMSHGKGVAIYPISKGREENFVFFITDPREWTGKQEAIQCSKEEMIKDLQGWDERLIRLLDWVCIPMYPHLRDAAKVLKAQPRKWPVFHHPKTPTYVNGRIALLGDVAHASSPGQAAGAGQGLEDAVVLAHLLSLVGKSGDIPAAFKAYDSIRRPRAQEVVQTSQEAGEMYAWLHPEFGDDMCKIVENANQRLHWIWEHDVAGDVSLAEAEFRRLVS